MLLAKDPVINAYAERLLMLMHPAEAFIHRKRLSLLVERPQYATPDHPVEKQAMIYADWAVRRFVVPALRAGGLQESPSARGLLCIPKIDSVGAAVDAGKAMHRAFLILRARERPLEAARARVSENSTEAGRLNSQAVLSFSIARTLRAATNAAAFACLANLAADACRNPDADSAVGARAAFNFYSVACARATADASDAAAGAVNLNPQAANSSLSEMRDQAIQLWDELLNPSMG